MYTLCTRRQPKSLLTLTYTQSFIPTSKIFCFAKYPHTCTTPFIHSPLSVLVEGCVFMCLWELDVAISSTFSRFSYVIWLQLQRGRLWVFPNNMSAVLLTLHKTLQKLGCNNMQRHNFTFYWGKGTLLLNVCTLSETLLSSMRWTPISFKQDFIEALVKGREIICLINLMCKSINKT